MRKKKKEVLNQITQITKLRKTHLKEAAARAKIAASLLKKVQKEHGKESLRLLSKDDGVAVPCLSTGRQEFDDFLTGRVSKRTKLLKRGSGKGLPKGRIIEIYGPESSGKTTWTLSMIAAAQKAGGLCGLVDAEHAYDGNWARKIGVNTDELFISQPDCGEQALDVVHSLVKSGKLDIVVVDSVAALVPKAEIEGDMQKQRPGLQAAMMSKALRRLVSIAERTGTIVIFINQVRMKIGVMFGNPETTPGGQALKFYSSIRLDIRFAGQLKRKIKGKDRPYGIISRLKTVKNKVAEPFRVIKFKLEHGVGITEIAEEIKN